MARFKEGETLFNHAGILERVISINADKGTYTLQVDDASVDYDGRIVEHPIDRVDKTYKGQTIGVGINLKVGKTYVLRTGKKISISQKIDTNFEAIDTDTGEVYGR